MAKYPRLKKAGKRGKKLLKKGTKLGSKILPEVFEGGSGLDRVTFDPIKANSLNFNDINSYLKPALAEATGAKSDINTRYGELMDLNRAKLGGLEANENQALRESYYRPIDRERQGALRDVARTSGLGAGAAFGQKRALGRDYADARLGAERQLLLDNVGVKRQALQDFGGVVDNRNSALSTAVDRIAGVRGLQASAKQNVGQFNINNQISADQFNSTGQFGAKTFNAGQQKGELGAKVGAISTGTGLIGDERDKIGAKKTQDELLAFLKERDENLWSQAQSLFG